MISPHVDLSRAMRAARRPALRKRPQAILHEALGDGGFRQPSRTRETTLPRSGRQAARAAEAEPARHLEAGQRVGELRRVREERVAGGVAEREQAQLAALHLAGDVAEIGDHRVGPARDQVHRGQRRAAIGDVQQLDPGRAAQPLARQVLRAARADAGEGQRAGPRPRRFDELGRAAPGRPGAHHHAIGGERHVGDGREFRPHVNGQAGAGQLREDGHVAGRAHQHGEAVRRRAGGGLGGDHAVGAGAVLHHHGLAEPGRHDLGHGARDQVAGAAGREAHQDAGGTVRRPGGGGAGRRGGRRAGNGADH